MIPTEETVINNISGKHIINKKGIANLVGNYVPAQTYFELNFHSFFDGIIGSQFLAKTKAIINYKTEKIEFGKYNIEYEKYFPTTKLYSHYVEVKSLNDGDWLNPQISKNWKINYYRTRSL